jgi:hypothetical protein
MMQDEYEKEQDVTGNSESNGTVMHGIEDEKTEDTGNKPAAGNPTVQAADANLQFSPDLWSKGLLLAQGLTQQGTQKRKLAVQAMGTHVQRPPSHTLQQQSRRSLSLDGARTSGRSVQAASHAAMDQPSPKHSMFILPSASELLSMAASQRGVLKDARASTQRTKKHAA